jgi:hypothetical protein
MCMLTYGATTFKDLFHTCSEAANKLGKHIWDYGLLKRGNGLTKGIAGNAYGIYTLFKYYDIRRRMEEKRNMGKVLYLRQVSAPWNTRALLFGQALCDYNILHTQEEWQKKHGKTDYPFSLMEGLAGEVTYLSDVLINMWDSCIPSFEV